MGNVVSPDDLIEDYGCDALRMYELFAGPHLEMDAEWDDQRYRWRSSFPWTFLESCDRKC